MHRTLDSPAGDGVYGRLDGDLTIGIGLGTELGGRTPAGAGRLSLHYFWTAGLYLGYANAIGKNADPERTLSLGIDLRPLFVPRWSQNWERGPALLDLAFDSLSLGFGTYWSEPRNTQLGHERGLEASLGGGIPLFGTEPGLWLELRGILRAPDAVLGEADPFLLVSLAWHELLTTPLLR